MHLLDRERIKRRSDGIDLLRALLALWVIAVHLAIWGPLTATGAPGFLRSFESWEVSVWQKHGEMNPAVVAFIVLSGYCIHRNGCRRAGWSSRSYAVKRAFRIWPVYVAATIAGAVLFTIAVRENAAIAHLISGTNEISAQCMAVKITGISAFAPGLHTCGFQGNAPLVTVGVEIWLYVAYAFGAWLLLRGGRQRTLWLLILAVYASAFLLEGRHADAWAWWNNGSFPAFLLIWWIGAELVGGAWRQRSLLIAGAAGAVFLVTTLATYTSTSIAELHKLSFAVVAGFGIRLIDERVGALPRPLTLFGRSGYSLYAFHAPVLIVLVSAGVAWWIVALSAIVTGLVAFQVYERPLMLRGRALADRAAHPAPAPSIAVRESVG